VTNSWIATAVVKKSDDLASVVDAEDFGPGGPRNVDGCEAAAAIYEAVVGSAGTIIKTPRELTGVVDAPQIQQRQFAVLSERPSFLSSPLSARDAASSRRCLISYMLR
jgi:hypothetical protein